MESNLISGYLAYTTAAEFGAETTGDAPGTYPTTTIVSVSIVSQTIGSHC
ncbi:LxmA leader domain family RiPP [Nocardia sp. NPDC051570]